MQLTTGQDYVKSHLRLAIQPSANADHVLAIRLKCLAIHALNSHIPIGFKQAAANQVAKLVFQFWRDLSQQNWLDAASVLARIRRTHHRDGVKLRARLGQQVIGGDGIALAGTDHHSVITDQRFLDFALAENRTQLNRDDLAEVKGVVFAGEVIGHRLSLRTVLCTLFLYPIRHHDH